MFKIILVIISAIFIISCGPSISKSSNDRTTLSLPQPEIECNGESCVE